MKLGVLALFVPLASAACGSGQVSLTFIDFVASPVPDMHEVCPAAGSCVNMQSGSDGWSEKVEEVLMNGKACVRFFRSYDCPSGEQVWQPSCPDDRWSAEVPSNWQHGQMKSYTVWNR